MKKTMILFISISIILIFAGCSTDVQDLSGTDYLLAGYYMMAGEETPLAESGDSRATVPVHDGDYSTTSFADWISNSPTKINNYPEQGQKTYVTVSAHTVPNVYLISSRTEYPKREETIDYYLEEYYVLDDDNNDGVDIGDGIWTTADVIVDDTGTTDPYYRKTMEVHFQDGSVRKEWIADINHTDPNGTADYAHFDIDGSLTIPSDPLWEPADGGNAMNWSSKVYYYQKVNTMIGYFMKENKEIFGVRYYTEDDSLYTSLAYEKMLSRSVPSWSDTDSWWSDILSKIFGDTSDSGETLAESVIRYQINPGNNKKTVNTSTKVVPTFGESFTIDKSMEYIF